MKKTPRILIHGHIGRGNVGDEAMLQVILNLLHEYFSEGKFTIAYGSDTICKSHLTKPCNYIPRKFSAIFRELYKSDFFVVAGGTHLTCFGNNKKTKILGILRQTLLVLFAKLFRVKVLMLSVGVGPLNSAIARNLIRFTLKMVDFISVRDEGSYNLLGDLEYKGACNRCSDAAFFFEPNVAIIQRRDKKRLGVSILPYFTSHAGNPKEDVLLVKAVFDSVSAWLNVFNNAEVVILSVCEQSGQNSDTYVSNLLVELFNGDPRVSQCSLRGNPDALLDAMNGLSHFVGMRYHSVLFSCVTDIPTINIAYHEKNLMLAKELMLPEASVVSVMDVLNGGLLGRMPSFCNEPAHFIAKRKTPEFAKGDILPRNVFDNLLK